MNRMTSETPPPFELGPRLYRARRWAALGVLVTVVAHAVGSSWFDDGVGLDLRVGLALVVVAITVFEFARLGRRRTPSRW